MTAGRLAVRRRPAPRPTEKQVQRVVITLFRSFGFVVAATSQYRRSGMMLGLPDLLGWHQVETGYDFAFEVKRPAARTPAGAVYDPRDPTTWHPERLRPEQAAFRLWYERPLRFYGVGGILEAQDLLVRMGLATSSQPGLVQATHVGRLLRAFTPTPNAYPDLVRKQLGSDAATL